MDTVTADRGTFAVTAGSWSPRDRTEVPPSGPIAQVRAALADIAAGRPVVVVDDSRNGTGELVFAAELADPQLVAFAVRHTSGFLSVTISGDDADRLDLPLMAHDHEARPAYCVTVDASAGVGTGISARDRARTVRLLAAADTAAADLTRPGHVVPLRIRTGGVLRHPSIAEAAADLAVLAGLRPAAVLGAIVDDEPARMASGPESAAFALRHRLRLVTVSDVVAFRMHHERIVERAAVADLPAIFYRFHAVGYRSLLDDREHVALVHGEIGARRDVSVHVHHECAASDALSALLCGCAAQLQSALDTVMARGRGVVVHLRGRQRGPRLGRGPGALWSREPEDRSGNRLVAEAILADLGVRSGLAAAEHNVCTGAE